MKSLRRYIRQILIEASSESPLRDIEKLANSTKGITKKSWQKAIKKWYSNNADHQVLENILVPMHTLTFQNFENFINGSVTRRDELSTTPYLMDPTTGLPKKLSEGFLYGGHDMQLALSGRFTLCAEMDMHSGKGGKAAHWVDDEESYQHVKQSSGINKYWNMFILSPKENPWLQPKPHKQFNKNTKEHINYQLSALIYDKQSIMDSRIAWHEPSPTECFLDNWRIKAVIILEKSRMKPMPTHQRKWCEDNNIPIFVYKKKGHYWSPAEIR